MFQGTTKEARLSFPMASAAEKECSKGRKNVGDYWRVKKATEDGLGRHKRARGK